MVVLVVRLGLHGPSFDRPFGAPGTRRGPASMTTKILCIYSMRNLRDHEVTAETRRARPGRHSPARSGGMVG
jgi:hypothetical protein